MKKKKVFIQILLSYLVILTIPLLILGGVVFNFFLSTYNEELLSGRMNDLTGFQLSTDNIINGLNANAYAMFNSKEFTTGYLAEHYGNFYDINRKLSENMLSNDFIAGSFYANDHLKRLYTGRNIYSYENFEIYSLGYGVEADEIAGLLIDDKKAYWIPTQNVGRQESQNVLTYVVTNKVGASGSSASLFFQLKASKLDELAGKFTGRRASTVIAGYDGQLLYASNPELAEHSWEKWLESAERRSGEPVTLDVAGREFVIIQLSSTKSPLVYASIIPYDEIVAPVRYNQKVFILSVIIIALMCAVFILYFIRLTYTPIRTISKLARVFLEEPDEANELESARLALISVNERQSELMRERLALKLIRGGYPSLEALEREGAPYNCQLTGPSFRVIVFHIESLGQKPDIAFYQSVTKLVEDSISLYTEAVAINRSEEDTVYLIISGDEEELRGLSEKYAQIKNVIENTFGICLSVGIGNITSVQNVPESVSQANTAGSHNFIKTKGSITFYQDIEGSRSKLAKPYPTRDLDALHNAILHGDGERAELSMNKLALHIRDVKSLFYGVCLAYDILNTALRAMRELGCETDVIEQFFASDKNMPASIDEVIGIVNGITGEIVRSMDCGAGDSAVSDIHMSQLEQIIRVIGARFCDESFSVKTLAAHFEISVSNLSHFFKKHTGQTVSEHISLKRFEQAKDLLCGTEMNLQDIALKCGYSHLSTFMRQFKQRAGCTPANYRVNCLTAGYGKKSRAPVASGLTESTV